MLNLNRAYNYDLSDRYFWNNSSDLEDDLLRGDFYQLLSICADLHRNNPIATSVTRLMVEYIGQTGYKLECIDEQQKFSEKWMKNCSVRGDNFKRVRNQRITSLVESGSCLILFTQDPSRKKNEIGLKLEVIGGGRVVQDPKFPNNISGAGKKIINGVEYDSFGREVAFHYKTGDKYTRVTKYNENGMYNAILERSPEFDRESLTRPLPMIYPSIKDIKLIGDLGISVGNWARNTSSQGVIFETPDPRGLLSGMGLTQTDDEGNVSYKTEEILGQTEIVGKIKPDFLMMAPLGFKAHSIVPQGSAEYEPIFKNRQRAIASTQGIPEEMLFSNTDGKNFAVSKFVAQSFIKKTNNWATYLNVTDSIIIRQGWEEANLRGLASFVVDSPITWGGVSDFADVDRSKNATASQTFIKSGVSTVTAEKSRTGKDFQDDVRTTVGEMNFIREFCKENKWTEEQFFAYQRGELSIQQIETEKTIEVDDEVENDADDDKFKALEI